MKQIALKVSVLVGLILIIGSGFTAKENKGKQGFVKKPYSKENYPPTIFPLDTTKLWMSEGAIENDTVLIMGDGGPTNQLGYDYNGKIDWMYLNSFKNYYFVSLHQSSTYNPEIFNWQNSFTLEDGIKEIDNSSEMMSNY